MTTDENGEVELVVIDESVDEPDLSDAQEQAHRHVAETLFDPLSEVTRKTRKWLLGVSLLGLAISQTGLLPEKIPALGVEFAQTDQYGLTLIIMAVVGYYWASFGFYAWSDFTRNSLRVRASYGEAKQTLDAAFGPAVKRAVENEVARIKGASDADVAERLIALLGDDVEKRAMRETVKSLFPYRFNFLWRGRWTLDLLFPILVGLVALGSLWSFLQTLDTAAPA